MTDESLNNHHNDELTKWLSYWTHDSFFHSQITCPKGTSTSPRLPNRTFRDLLWTSCHQICLSKAVAGLSKFTFSYNNGFSPDLAHWVKYENKKLHILPARRIYFPQVARWDFSQALSRTWYRLLSWLQ